MTALRILILRSIALWAIPAFAVVELLTITSRSQVWASEWRWAFDYLGAVTVVLGPLCTGVGAAAAVMWSIHGRAQMIAASGRPGRHLAGTCLGITASVWLLHLAALALVVALVLRRDVGGHPDLVAAIPTFVILPAYVSVGLAVGTVRPVPWVSPVAVGVAFVATIALLRTPLSVLVRAGGATGSLVALEYEPWLLVTQGLFWSAVTACCIVVAGGVAARPLLRRRVVGLVVACAAMACITVWLGPDRFRVADDPPLTCRGSRPQVCTAPDYSSHLDSTVRAVARVDRLLASAGVPAPVRYEQGALARDESLPQGLVSISATAGTFTPSSLANGILNSYLGCPPGSREGRQVYQSAMPLLWLLLHAQGASDASEVGREVSPGFRAATESHWEEWLRAAVPRLQRCRPAPVAR